MRAPPLQVRVALELLWGRLCQGGPPCLTGVPAELALGSTCCCGCVHEARGMWQMSASSKCFPWEHCSKVCIHICTHEAAFWAMVEAVLMLDSEMAGAASCWP